MASRILRHLALLLFVLSAAVTLRSFRARDIILWDRSGGTAHEFNRWYLTFDRARVVAGCEIRENRASIGRIGWHVAEPGSGLRRASGWMEIDRRAFAVPGHGIGYREFDLPMILFLGAFAIPIVIWQLARWKNARRDLQGHCRQCGYDIRSSPERCPECGSPVIQAPIEPRQGHVRNGTILAVIIGGAVWFIFTDRLGSKAQPIAPENVAAANPATTRTTNDRIAIKPDVASGNTPRVFLISTRSKVSDRNNIRAELQVFLPSADGSWIVGSTIVAPGCPIVIQGPKAPLDTGMTLLSIRPKENSAVATIGTPDGKTLEHDLLSDIASDERKSLIAVARRP